MGRLYLIKLNLYPVPQCYILNQSFNETRRPLLITLSLQYFNLLGINKEKISRFIRSGNKLVHLTRLRNFNQFKGAIDRILIFREDVGLFLKFPDLVKNCISLIIGNVTEAIMSTAEGVKNIIRIL